MLFTFWIFNLLLCCILRDGQDPHLPVDVVNKSYIKKNLTTKNNFISFSG